MVGAHQRVADPVNARVRAIARRQAHALCERRASAADDDLRPEVHHEAHAEAGGAGRVVRARDVVHQPRERDVMLRAVAATDLVHEPVAHAFERRSRRARAAVDARQLGRRVAGLVDVLRGAAARSSATARRDCPIWSHCQSHGRGCARAVPADGNGDRNGEHADGRAPAHRRRGYRRPPGRPQAARRTCRRVSARTTCPWRTRVCRMQFIHDGGQCAGRSNRLTESVGGRLGGRAPRTDP